MKTSGIAIVILMLASPAAAANALNTSDKAPMFCLDSAGAYQPFQHTDYARIRNGFAKNFGFGAAVEEIPGSDSHRLVFSAGGREHIAYEVQPHESGIALQSMKVRLDGVTEDLAGTDMCWRTFTIVNGAGQ